MSSIHATSDADQPCYGCGPHASPARDAEAASPRSDRSELASRASVFAREQLRRPLGCLPILRRGPAIGPQDAAGGLHAGLRLVPSRQAEPNSTVRLSDTLLAA